MTAAKTADKPNPEIFSLGIYRRLAIAAGRVGPISKDEKNREQGFLFRSIEAITGRARTVFADLGIGIVPRKIVSIESEQVTSRKGAVGYRTTAIVQYSIGCEYSIDGVPRRDELVVEMAGEAIDYGDKSTSKAVQMAYKYALTEALVIGAEQDADEASHDLADRSTPAPESRIVTLKKRAAAKYGVSKASLAWKTLFDTDEPDPDTLTEEKMDEILVALDSIVEELGTEEESE